jgi:rSAM/selenodomain-associated transferase 2
MRISVVIPTLGEQATTGSAITSARQSLGACQVIVADGRSADRTRELAAAAGALVVDAPGTRAEAMNTGARAATGEALLFLHADTTLPDGAGEAIRRTLAHADAGAFSVRFDERPRPARLAAALYGRFHRGVYGDQAIFVTRVAFDRAGGYRPLPIMEDYDFVQRVRHAGRFVVLPDAVTTSARRQRAHGETRTFLTVAAIKLLYRLGVPPARLAHAYRQLS